jgi:hypothetical protein
MSKGLTVSELIQSLNRRQLEEDFRLNIKNKLPVYLPHLSIPDTSDGCDEIQSETALLGFNEKV